MFKRRQVVQAAARAAIEPLERRALLSVSVVVTPSASQVTEGSQLQLSVSATATGSLDEQYRVMWGDGAVDYWNGGWSGTSSGTSSDVPAHTYCEPNSYDYIEVDVWADSGSDTACAIIANFVIDEGTIKWRSPLGTFPPLAAQGITNTGSVHARNGPIVTAGGLVFIGSTGDRYIHAFDKDTGKVIWETQIEASPDGIPAVYEVGRRQYVAFSAGGRKQGYYVFALPNSDSKSKKLLPTN